MNVYADSSFFVSVYLPDRHTEVALERLARRPQVWLTTFHESEFVHAILQLFRGHLSTDGADQAIRGFRLDRDAGLWEVVDFPAAAFATATALAESYVARLGVRTLDSLHVARRLSLRPSDFGPSMSGRQSWPRRRVCESLKPCGQCRDC